MDASESMIDRISIAVAGTCTLVYGLYTTGKPLSPQHVTQSVESFPLC